MSLAVKTLREGRVDVVLCTGVYQGCAAFIRSARDLGWNVPISNLSFVGSEALLGLLTEHGRKAGQDYTRAIINSQVVPSYDDLTLPGVREYRALMDKNNPAIPHSLRDPRYTPRSYSFVVWKVSSMPRSSSRACAGQVPISQGAGSGRVWNRCAASTWASAPR